MLSALSALARGVGCFELVKPNTHKHYRQSPPPAVGARLHNIHPVHSDENWNMPNNMKGAATRCVLDGGESAIILTVGAQGLRPISAEFPPNL